MTWTTLTFSYRSILTAAKLTQLSDNTTAFAFGESGSEKINTPLAFSAGSIDSTKLLLIQQAIVQESVAAGATWTPTQTGLWLPLYYSNDIKIEAYINGTWQSWSYSVLPLSSLIFINGSTSWRFRNTGSTTRTVTLIKF